MSIRLVYSSSNDLSRGPKAPAPRATSTQEDSGLPQDAVYDDLRSQGLEALRSGRMEQAHSHFEAAWRRAQQLGNPTLEDRAFCNQSAVAIELGTPLQNLGPLRRILVARQNIENCRLAAYNIARIYELTKDYKKGLFYARSARDLARLTKKPEAIAACHNMIGNLLLAESYFDEACAEYDRTLGMIGEEPSLRRALILENVGYCRVVQGSPQEGFSLLFESLRMLRRLEAHGFDFYPHLSLCYAYLEAGKPQRAMQHGLRALVGAREMHNDDSVKYALYLLGDAARQSDAPDEAQRYLMELQQSYYPNSPEVVHFLMMVNVRQVINLKA
ncbi:MAG: hypothetical protein AAGD01_00395 [Acidobacteriota bacterium]